MSARPYDAVIFDLDGTLVDSRLDFAAIRQEINASISEGKIDGPILEALPSLSPQNRAITERILEEHERRGVEEATEFPGAVRVLEELSSEGIRTAILTRNSRVSLEAILERFPFEVEATRTREDGLTKPDPEPVRALCERLEVAPERTIGVGDYRFDLEAARAAGALAILVRRPGNAAFETLAERVIDDLDEILAIAGGIGPSGAESP